MMDPTLEARARASLGGGMGWYAAVSWCPARRLRGTRLIAFRASQGA